MHCFLALVMTSYGIPNTPEQGNIIGLLFSASGFEHLRGTEEACEQAVVG